MRLMGEHRDVSFLMLPPPAPDRAEVTAAQIDAWYKAHQGEYRKPETVRLEYVEVDASSAQSSAADEADLRKRYQENIAKYSSAEKREVSHILVEVPSNADAAAKKAAEAKANKLAAEAKAPGADFAALAKANSDDAGSKEKGGDLGWMAKGGMPGAFDDAAFAMKDGEVRGPIKSDFGYHIVKLNAIQPGVQRTFEEVRPELEKELQEGSRERAFNELTGKLVDAVYKTPTSLEPAAKAMGLELKTTPPFTRAGGPGIASDQKVLRAAFSDVLLQDGTASDPIELGPEHSVLVRVIDHVPERALKLDEVKDAVIAEIHADRERKAAETAANALIKLANEKGLAEAVKTLGLEVTEAKDITRSVAMPTPEITAAFFNVPRPQIGKVTAHKVQLGGQFVLFAVSAARDADLGQVTPQERNQLRQQVSMANGIQAQEAFVRAARQSYKIKVAEDRL
jgi:peptidyl-prolyl cis-trans isomerase D